MTREDKAKTTRQNDTFLRVAVMIWLLSVVVMGTSGVRGFLNYDAEYKSILYLRSQRSGDYELWYHTEDAQFKNEADSCVGTYASKEVEAVDGKFSVKRIYREAPTRKHSNDNIAMSDSKAVFQHPRLIYVCIRLPMARKLGMQDTEAIFDFWLLCVPIWRFRAFILATLALVVVTATVAWSQIHVWIDESVDD